MLSFATASCFAQKRMTELEWSNFNASHIMTNPTNVTIWKSREIQFTLFLTNRDVVIGTTNILQYQIKNLSTNLIEVVIGTDDHALDVMNSLGKEFHVNPEEVVNTFDAAGSGSKEIYPSNDYEWSNPLIIKQNIKPNTYTLKATRLMFVYFPTNGTHPTGYILQSEPLTIKIN